MGRSKKKVVRTPLDEARALVERGLGAIDRQMQAAEARFAEKLALSKFDSMLSSHIAFLTEKAAAAMDALRLYEKHERDAVEQISPEEADELVAAYVQDMTAERRATLRMLLDELDGGERLLA